MLKRKCNTPEVFNADYFENGVDKKISCYKDYHWMPDRSFSEAFAFIGNTCVTRTDRVVDFGCAKGFFVRAMRELEFNCFGVDISTYASSQATQSVSGRLMKMPDILDTRLTFDYGFCKDVLEHSNDILTTLSELRSLAPKWLLVVPLGDGRHYRIPEYEKDKTHLIRQDELWWVSRFNIVGFDVVWQSYRVPGLKDKWYDAHKEGNLFVKLQYRKEPCKQLTI